MKTGNGFLFALCLVLSMTACGLGPKGCWDTGTNETEDAGTSVTGDGGSDVTRDAGTNTGDAGSNVVECTVDQDCAVFLTSVCEIAHCVQGICSVRDAPDNTACNDDNACTRTDACKDGVCVGSNPVVCTAMDECHATGTCNPTTGICSNPPGNEGTLCDDHNACTRTSTCHESGCTGSDPVVCQPLDACHVAGVCNTETGECTNPTGNENGPCDDDDACTHTDTCQQGVCTGSNPVVCQALDACHVVGVCNSATGECSNPTGNEDGACDDNDACTRTSTCKQGVCTGSDPVVCQALDACHVAGVCNAETGECSNPTDNESGPCDDNDSSTGHDRCVAGECKGTPCTCVETTTCCDGCLSRSQGAVCYEGFQFGGRCTAAGACEDRSNWLVVADNDVGGILLIDSMTNVVHGPYLQGELGTEDGGRFDVVVTPDGLTAIVSNFGDASIFFIDLTVLEAPAVLGSVHVPMFAEDIALTHDGRYALVTDGGFSSHIVVVDVATRAIIEDFDQPEISSQAVTAAPDGTVITVDYFMGRVYALVIDDAGHLTHSNTYLEHISLTPESEPTELGDYTFRPINVAVAPDGQTVLVGSVEPYNKSPDGLDPVVDTGFERSPVAVFLITEPGTLTLQGIVKGIPRQAQSIAFSDNGQHAYLYGNKGINRPDDGLETNDEDDLLVELDITGPGMVTYNPARSVSVRHRSTSQLFGVDTIAVDGNAAFMTFPTVSGATYGQIIRVDLTTLEVTRLASQDIAMGIAVVPLRHHEIPVDPANQTCDGHCGWGGNRNGHCMCDPECENNGDCCPDYATVCNTCDPRTCTSPHACITDSTGAYTCGCKRGYVLNIYGDCADVDECDNGTGTCTAPATCENYAGGWRCNCEYPLQGDGKGGCQCGPGYAPDDVHICKDIDECALGLDNCSGFAQCVNRDGGFDCMCPGNYQGDGKGGCECPEGTLAVSSTQCVDLDECSLGTHHCQEGATCQNAVGGFECLCPAPFVADHFGGCRCPRGYEADGLGGCADIDECARDLDGCRNDAECQNNTGGFQCVCPAPYEPDGFRGCQCPYGFKKDGLGGCVDINECTDGTALCHGGAECQNVEGGDYLCNCTAPFVPDGHLGCRCPPGQTRDGAGGCRLVNDCTEGVAHCHEPATCMDLPVGYECTCTSPWISNGTNGCRCPDGQVPDGSGGCRLVDECTENLATCHGGAFCEDLPVGYQCNCPSPLVPDGSNGCACAWGYKPDGAGGCINKNECTEGGNNCDPNATCTDATPGWTCTCPGGWWDVMGDGTYCEEY